jgi:TPR repeat protein
VWFEHAAKAGDEVAMEELALAFIKGEGVARNRRAALQ